VLAWWLTWVATMVRGNVGGNPDLDADVQDVSDRVLGASVSTVGAVLTAVAAVLAIRMVTLGQPPADVPVVDSMVGDRSIDRATAMAGPASAANPRS